jgi:hypothetical protein
MVERVDVLFLKSGMRCLWVNNERCSSIARSGRWVALTESLDASLTCTSGNTALR